jgi:hypothetical protein
MLKLCSAQLLQLTKLIKMIVRGKSASGMVRWTVDADKPLLVLIQHVSAEMVITSSGSSCI